MKNIDILTKFITKNGPDGIMIHTVAGTKYWIVAQKIDINKWLITLCDPMGSTTSNLGTASEEQHIRLWTDLTRLEIENRIAQTKLVEELKSKINKSQN